MGPRAEIDAGEIVVPYSLQAQSIGEARRGRNDRAMARDRAQPHRGPHQEDFGCNQHESAGEGHGREQTPDEPHVVVQGQPRHADTAAEDLGARREQDLERRTLRHQVPVRQRHGFWIRGRARGKLDEPERIGLDRDLRLIVRCAQLGHRSAPQFGPGLLDGLTEQELHAAIGQHQRRPHIGEHSRRRSDVFVHASEPHRRVERDRHRPGELGAEERLQQIAPSRKHERDAIAGFDSAS